MGDHHPLDWPSKNLVERDSRRATVVETRAPFARAPGLGATIPSSRATTPRHPLNQRAENFGSDRRTELCACDGGKTLPRLAQSFRAGRPGRCQPPNPAPERRQARHRRQGPCACAAAPAKRRVELLDKRTSTPQEKGGAAHSARQGSVSGRARRLNCEASSIAPQVTKRTGFRQIGGSQPSALDRGSHKRTPLDRLFSRSLVDRWSSGSLMQSSPVCIAKLGRPRRRAARRQAHD